MFSRPTIRDVAQRCGYSPATVSMALRDHAHLPETTRRLIQKIAREIGYRPDPLLASVASCRWKRNISPRGPSTLAVVVTDRNLFEGRAGALERASRLGYRLEYFPIQNYADGRSLSAIIFNRGIAGVLIGQIFTPDFLATFDWSPFSAVAVSEGTVRLPIHLVKPNHFQAVQAAWDQAAGRGYRRIGLAIFDQPHVLDFHERLAAFFERQASIPAARRLPVLKIPAALDRKQRHDNLRGCIGPWIRRHRPDALLAFNGGMAWGVRIANACEPDDLAVFSLWNEEPMPEFSGMTLSSDEIGSRAVDWVDALLRAGERGIPQHPSITSINFEWFAADTK